MHERSRARKKGLHHPAHWDAVPRPTAREKAHFFQATLPRHERGPTTPHEGGGPKHTGAGGSSIVQAAPDSFATRNGASAARGEHFGVPFWTLRATQCQCRSSGLRCARMAPRKDPVLALCYSGRGRGAAVFRIFPKYRSRAPCRRHPPSVHGEMVISGWTIQKSHCCDCDAINTDAHSPLGESGHRC